MKEHAPIPVLDLWGRLVVTLQGDVSDAQADSLSSSVLERIRDRGSRGLAIDVSGLWMIDSHLCAVLARLAAAARLMGADVVLCGMTPTVVLTLQAMGIELRGVTLARNLESALEILGIEVRDDRVDDEAEDEDDDDEDDATFTRRATG